SRASNSTRESSNTWALPSRTTRPVRSPGRAASRAWTNGSLPGRRSSSGRSLPGPRRMTFPRSWRRPSESRARSSPGARERGGSGGAAEGGEVAGGCWGWESIRATWRKGIESDEVAVLLQTAPRPASALPNVPLAMSFAKSDEARRLIKVGIQDAGAITRPFAVTRGTPKDRVELLRKAFLETLRDPEFLAEARKINLDIDPMSGEELERTVHGLFTLDPAFLARLKEILK